MNPQELTELKARCQAAVTYGRQLGNAAGYIAELEREAGPVPLDADVAPNSAGHLLALIVKVERVRGGEEKANKPQAAPEPAQEPSRRDRRGKKAKKDDDEAEDPNSDD